MTTRLSRAAGLALLLGLSACYAGAGRSFSPATFSAQAGWVWVADVPVVRQHGEHDCGAAAVAMVLGYWRLPGTQDEVRAASQVSSSHGLSARFLRDYLRGRGLDAYLLEGTFADLAHELASGRPVLVGLHKPYTTDVYAHYVLVVGTNQQARRVVVIDPADGWREYSFDGFAAEWQPSRHLMIVTAP